MTEWFLYVPQSRQSIDDLVVRAQTAESAGFDGVAFLDHLETPMAPASPIWEAMTVATWVAAQDRAAADRALGVVRRVPSPRGAGQAGRHTGRGLRRPVRTRARIRLDARRARQVRRRHGRVPGHASAALGDTLDALRAVLGRRRRARPGTDAQPAHPDRARRRRAADARTWSAARRLVESAGHHTSTGCPSSCRRSGRPGSRCSRWSASCGSGDDAEAVTEQARRRWGHLGSGLVCGDADTLKGHFANLEGQGAQRFYVWFADFAPPESIAEFGESVIAG